MWKAPSCTAQGRIHKFLKDFKSTDAAVPSVERQGHSVSVVYVV